MKLMAPGTELDGFRIGKCLHAGGMAHVYEVSYADARPSPFPMVMKVPRMTAGDGAENIVSFEVELQMLQVLQGAYVPRLVASGDLLHLPYLVMEHIPGQSLQQWWDVQQAERTPVRVEELIRIGVATAKALQSLHAQNVCHLDLKPANLLLCPDGRVVLLDFGLSCHAHYPDLLAEELRKAVGSPTWMAPEQVVGVRGRPSQRYFCPGCHPLRIGHRRIALWRSTNPGRFAPASVDEACTAATASPRSARLATGSHPALPAGTGARPLPLGSAPGL